ncbi:hypothetical protein [Nonomuraea angiospora]|uniref:hypothetical protein n=1 Tax=Nonomuraea angiospora TaxID=46172 RepID=UPI0029B694BB|nr:hypothetical protein [Nonomuraea angiospora]MDX3110160.1 hypothetical protein [Nonomuraea angiospora]
MRILAVSAATLVVLAALAVSAVALLPQLSAASPITVEGSVTVRGDRPAVLTENELTCTTGGGYNDIRQGAQVVVTDAAGKTIALGQLGAGSWKRDTGCIFLFTVADVPAGEKFYGIEVSHRGRVQYTAAQVSAPVELSIGG